MYPIKILLYKLYFTYNHNLFFFVVLNIFRSHLCTLRFFLLLNYICFATIWGSEMKNFILISIIIFIFTSCKNEITIQSSKLPEGLIAITKTETGFNIYSNTGELILEYTKQNCDSLVSENS